MSKKKPKKKVKPQPQLTRGEDNIVWIEENCFIPEGSFIGKPVRLRDWQKEFILRVYDNPHGTRRAILSVGRKNAKTTLAAFLLLLHLVGLEAKPNSQLFSDAQSREQAGIIFELAAKIVRMSPTLAPHVQIRETAKQLLCPEMGTKYKALSAEVATSFGLSPIFIVHDELGQVRGPKSELFEALETAVGAQAQPLSIIISTQAPTENDLFSILIDDALASHDKRVVLCLHTAPMELDPFEEKTIRLANPAFGDFQNAEEILAMAQDAKRMPSREADFRNLVLNQRIEANNPFITKSLWDSCAALPSTDWGRAPVYGGLDLSAVNDLTALILISFLELKWQVRSTFWLPEANIRERSRLDHTPYDVWSREGWLQLTPGKSIEYEYVAHYLREQFDIFNIKKIAFDRWNFKNLKPWLLKAGFTEAQVIEHFVEFGQGFQSMSPALRTLESFILNGKLMHGGHKVLKMCAGNAVVRSDPSGNRKLDKARSNGRIDGMVALAMAAAMAEVTVEVEEKKYQMMIF
jgi:phage terminase large subunit-like protein